MNPEHQQGVTTMCEHKLYEENAVKALQALGGKASLLTLVDKMAKEYAVPVPDAFLAIVDAKGVYTDHIESMVVAACTWRAISPCV